MARTESDNRRGFAEKAFTSFRNGGLIAAFLGVIAIWAAIPIGVTLFEVGAVGAGASEFGRQAAASGKPK